MSPTSSAVHLDGNQNFFFFFLQFSVYTLVSFGVKVRSAYSYLTCQEAKLVTDLLFQGHVQAVSRGTSPTRTKQQL